MCVSHLMKWLSEKKEFLRSSTGGRLLNLFKSSRFYSHNCHFVSRCLGIFISNDTHFLEIGIW